MKWAMKLWNLCIQIELKKFYWSNKKKSSILTFSAIATGATNAEVDEEADGAVTRRKRFAWKLEP